MQNGKTLSIRRAKPDDVEDIAALLGEMGHPMRRADVLRQVRRCRDMHADIAIVVAEKENKVCGFMAVQQMDTLPCPAPWLRITAMCVAPAYRHHGIGQALEKAAMEMAERLQCGWMEITSSHPRPGAHRFYLRIGYQDTHRCFTKSLPHPICKGDHL